LSHLLFYELFLTFDWNRALVEQEIWPMDWLGGLVACIFLPFPREEDSSLWYAAERHNEFFAVWNDGTKFSTM